MRPKPVDTSFLVSQQITQDDLEALAASGIRSIICSRPDREDIGQPSFHDLELAAKKAGIEAAYLPIVVGKLSPDDVAAFGRTAGDLAEADPRILPNGNARRDTLGAVASLPAAGRSAKFSR